VTPDEWFESIAPDWRTRTPQPLAEARQPVPMLGDEEAAVEWNEDPERSTRRFVHLETYDELRNMRSLFLFGRRGTGKTTYLNMLESEIKRGEVSTYGTCCILQSQSLILGMAATVRLSVLADLPEAELANALTPVWKWIVSVSAMHGVLENKEPSATEPVEVKQVRAFLDKALGPRDSTLSESVRDSMHELFVKALDDGEHAPSAAGRVFKNITSLFRSEAFVSASATLDALTRKRPCLVLLDSGDVYAIRDPIPRAVVTALIACLTDFSKQRDRSAIVAKAAFPSEILPHVYPYNRGKMEGRIVIITWSYKDLVALLAKRFASIGNGHSLPKAQSADSGPAQQLIYNTLPEFIETRVGIPFDTLAYVIRHTQRTPRQVIMLMNGILTYAKSCGWRVGTKIDDQQLIVKGVHLYLGHLVNDSIDMHRSMYDRLDQIVQGTLAEQQCYFPSDSLGRKVKEVSFVRHSVDLERVDVVRLLFEIGVLGLAKEAHPIQMNPPQRFLVQAVFEYQLKQTVTPGAGGYCVVHPMFYEWLGTKVDANTFVYPLAFEAEEREILSKYGAALTVGQ
jgi:hypothetical protein